MLVGHDILLSFLFEYHNGSESASSRAGPTDYSLDRPLRGRLRVLHGPVPLAVGSESFDISVTGLFERKGLGADGFALPPAGSAIHSARRTPAGSGGSRQV